MKTAVVNYDEKSFKFMIQDENEYIQKTLLTGGKFYEIDLLESLTKLIDVNEGVALDIGANLGNHSIFFAGVLGLQVHSFEPLAQTYNLLQQNIKINEFENKIFTNNSAVGAENAWCEIEKVDQTNLGSTTVLQSQNGKIPLVTIDSYLGEINFSGNIKLIKIDVEGFEVPVLNGAMKTIKLFKPLLIIECQTMDRLYEALTALKNDYFVYDVNCVTPTFTLIHQSYIDNKLIESNNEFGIPFYINKLLNYNSAQIDLNLKYREINAKYENLKAVNLASNEDLNVTRVKYRESSEEVNFYKHKLEESHSNIKLIVEEIRILAESNSKYKTIADEISELKLQLAEKNYILTESQALSAASVEKEHLTRIELIEVQLKYADAVEQVEKLKSDVEMRQTADQIIIAELMAKLKDGNQDSVELKTQLYELESELTELKTSEMELKQGLLETKRQKAEVENTLEGLQLHSLEERLQYQERLDLLGNEVAEKAILNAELDAQLKLSIQCFTESNVSLNELSLELAYQKQLKCEAKDSLIELKLQNVEAVIQHKFEIEQLNFILNEQKNNLVDVKKKLNGVNLKYRTITEHIDYYKKQLSGVTDELFMVKQSLSYKLSQRLLFKK